ncbi:type IV pilus secretin PilQ [Hydrogenophaga soli]
MKQMQMGRLGATSLGVAVTQLVWVGVVMCWSGAATAQNTIKSLVGQVVAGQEMVTIDTTDALAVDPVSFSTATPARIALDFQGVQSAVDRGSIALGLRTVRSANVVQAGEKTRVILNLQQPTPFKLVRRGTQVDVILQEGGVADVSKGAVAAVDTASAAPLVSAAPSAIRDIDFRRGADGAGRLVVDFNQQQPEVDIAVKGRNLVVTVPRYELPEFLRRKLDVSDFGTPVQEVSAETASGSVRITVTPRGNWEHSAFQTDGRLVVEVREQKQDPNKLVQGPGYGGDKLSLNFQSIDVRALLQVIADFTNFNIVTSDAVGGAVTLRLKDVPWDQALEIILQSKRLGMKKSGNVIWVAPMDELAARDKAELESRVSIESMEVLKTQSFVLNYAKASDVAAQIGSSGAGAAAGGAGGAHGAAGAGAGSILSSRGSVIAEPRTNQLFVTDIPSRLEQVQAFITKLDVPVRQVLIEARIVEADDKFGRSLGVKLGGSDMRGIRGGDAGYAVGSGNRVAFGGSYDAINSTVGITSPAAATANNFVNLPATGLGGVSPTSFALSLFSPAANRFLNLELSALEADSRGKVVSSPRLVTADKVKAIIEQGVEFPYQTTAPNGGTTIAFKKASLKLEVTPQITPEGAVILEVEVNKDSPGELLLGARAINTKRIQTQVLVENGGTVVIGGIFESTEQEAENKVPLLGDVPVVGNLFKNRSKSMEKSEMLVFITPKVVESTQIR